MPKKVYLAAHLSQEELKEKYKKATDPVEGRRWHLLWKISLGWTIIKSAAMVGLSYGYAQSIVSRYNQGSESGITNQKKKSKPHRRGKAALLTQEQLSLLASLLKEPSPDGGIWTGPKIARWIEKETGREKVGNQRGWDYLKKLNYSWQKPRPKHYKADEEEQKEFKKNLGLKVKELQEKYRDKKVEVWFFDEHRVGLKPIIRKVWAPVGERPTAIVQHRYEWLYVYGFVEPLTGKTHWYLIPRVSTKWLNKVYENFVCDVEVGEEKIILLVQDNAGWHKSKEVNLPTGIMAEFLPAYSPELQPAERLWQLVDEPLVNKHFQSLDEIEEVLCQRCRFLSENRQEEIKNLTYYHWFKYE